MASVSRAPSPRSVADEPIGAPLHAELGSQIVRRYVDAHDPGATVADYLLDGGVVVRIEPLAIRAWDYADASYV